MSLFANSVVKVGEGFGEAVFATAAWNGAGAGARGGGDADEERDARAGREATQLVAEEPVGAEPGTHGRHGSWQRCAERVDTGSTIGVDRGEREGDPDVAVGEDAHRREHVAGREGAGGAGRWP